MTRPTNTGNEAPQEGLSAPESAQDPDSGTERRPGGPNGPQAGAQGREPLRDRIAAAIESEIYEYRERGMWWPETGGVTEEIARLATRGAMSVRDRESEQMREQLAARDAALAACTAQLVHDQAALARLRQGLADVITDMRGITGARHWIAALDSVLNPAHDGGPAKEATR